MAQKRYKSNADKQFARKDDAKRAKETEERLEEQDKEWKARQKRPAWGVMWKGSMWFWAAWKVRSGEVTEGGLEKDQEVAQQKAIERSHARVEDHMLPIALHPAYEKLKAENRLER